MLIIICAILVLFCRVSCVLPWTGRQRSCPHTWRCFNICDWCQLYPPYGVWHTTTDHVLPWQFALSYSEHMCSINKDSLFIERCFIILHANDRSNCWSGWIWHSLTLLIFCTFSLQVYITCTVYSVYTCLEPRLSFRILSRSFGNKIRNGKPVSLIRFRARMLYTWGACD